MGRSKPSQFYAIKKGENEAYVTQSWLYAAPIINGCSGVDHKGFNTFNEAKGWLLKLGCGSFHFHQGPVDRPTKPGKGTKYYVVGKGRKPGIYSTWDEAKAQVDGFPNAIHKSFNHREDAEEMMATFRHGGLDQAAPEETRQNESEGRSYDIAGRLSDLKL